MNKGKIQVLLVEDNPGDARLIQEMFSDDGDLFCFECADRLSKCLARLSEPYIDAVLLDLGLPDSCGIETFISVHNQNPSMPVVVLTGLNDEEIGIMAVQKGAQDYLMKGEVNKNLLARSLRYAIERQNLLCDLKDANTKINTLEGLLPICSGCKKIRDDKGVWDHIELYIKARSKAQFTHSMCPECIKKYYPELYKGEY